MTRKYTNRRYLDGLRERVLVFDGAMGTSIQNMDLTADDFGGEQYNGCNDYLALVNPEVVEKVHRSFLEVGADVIETDTFRSNPLTLQEYGLADKTYDINFAAASIARKVADEFSQNGQPRYVAGSIGPSGKLISMSDPELSNITFDELVDIIYQQALGLVKGGVDFILIETQQDILEVKAAVLGAQKAFQETGIYLPIQSQVSLDTTGRMLLGTDISAVLSILEGLPIDVIGMNCSTGPEHMREAIAYLSENSTLPISCIPNAGLPLNVDGEAVYPMKPEPFASELYEFINKNHINVVGGCCGTTPEHISQLVNKVKHQAPQAREIEEAPKLASSIRAVFMQQTPPPFLIGERCNTQGSRAFKNIILEEDFDAVLDLANKQIDNGAHGLDICVALTETANEAQIMEKVIKTLAPVVSIPFIIDTTELDVLEVALKTAPGRCLINSTNLESGREKADKIFALAKKYNAAVLALTIDEQGMAKTAQRKLEIAQRIYDIAVNEYQLKPGDLVFDDLTFTMATGDAEFANSAVETMQGLKLIKENLPGVLTSLGVSNVSFGLKPPTRKLLNSIMLYHCVQYGLDMAIVNPVQIIPYPDIPAEQKELAENLLFNRDPEALQKLIVYFEENAGINTTSQTSDSALQAMSPQERLAWKILHRCKDDVDKDIDDILALTPEIHQSEAAVSILNNVLLPAMKDVGDKFGSGELILPFVLQSAEVMKKSIAYLENYLDQVAGVSKGKIVLATVYGDVHDIGKGLVKTILSNNGFEVIDLGKQVPAETIITEAVNHQADAIGLSALLVSTSKQMPLIVNELQRRNLSFPVLIGGAAINPRFGRRILQTEDGEYYQPGVFYCKDAFEGLDVLEQLRIPDQKDALLKDTREKADFELGRATHSAVSNANEGQRSSVELAPDIPTPPFWGAKHVKEMPLDSVFTSLAKRELFRLSWGAKNTRGEEWVKLEKEYEERLNKMRKEALKNPWLFPQAVYGYWPAQADGDDLVLYDPRQVNTSAVRQEIMRFSFPRQPKGEFLCLSDYFEPLGSERIDVVAFQIVTVGQQASEKFDALQTAGDYSEAYFTHGLGVQMAEATADYLHQHIRRELGLTTERGQRYSWGYPAIPSLDDHQKVFELLPAEKDLAMKLTSAFQMVPEQSTAAIILHHPQAKYYSVGEDRLQQLLV
ncbi:MAG: methionine synthase [Anaerolineaceae bacterium]|nr:methionine synthase [Anaerolineaceae bacterium]